MNNMRKKLAALLTVSVIVVTILGFGITAYAGGAVPSHDTEPVCTTPGGVFVYGRYYVLNGLKADGIDEYYTTEFPIEYLMAIDTAGITNEMGDYEKCVRINNYLCTVAEYGFFDFSSRTKPRLDMNYFTADGLDLIQYGIGVCHEYTDAFNTMATMLGIESGIYSSNSLGHTWNYVVIDGVTYFIDVTWNDMQTYVNGVKLNDGTNKNRYLMSTELWDGHKADDITIWRAQDHYARDLEAEKAAKEAREAAIIEAFMKDPYGYLESLDEANPDSKTYVWDPETCMWRVLQ